MSWCLTLETLKQPGNTMEMNAVLPYNEEFERKREILVSSIEKIWNIFEANSLFWSLPERSDIIAISVIILTYEYLFEYSVKMNLNFILKGSDF